MSSDALKRLTAFCAGQYNALHSHAPAKPKAKSYLIIMNQITGLRLSSERPAEDLLDWMSKPHADADLVRACQTVFEMLGSAQARASP